MKRRAKKASIWTAKTDGLLKDYYAIYKKPAELRIKFLREYRELIKTKKKITKLLSKIASSQIRHERAKKLGLIKK